MYGTSGVIHAWYIRCDRDAAAAGQPPGQPSHPAARGPGPGCLMGPGGAAGWLGWPGGWPAAASRSHLKYHT